MARKKNKLVYGVGINDVEYDVYIYDQNPNNSKLIYTCPYYVKWKEMLRRCFSEKFQNTSTTYKQCSIDIEWMYLSNFIKWVDSQPNRDWVNCELDKDFLIDGNKHYSPSTCAFMNAQLNTFILKCKASRGKYMIGVNSNRWGTYQAGCSDPFKVRSKYLGCFKTELEAHKAWQARKHEYACQLAELQEDPRVADALRQRYAPDKDWTDR